jgi:hypothetical protein
LSKKNKKGKGKGKGKRESRRGALGVELGG